MGKRNRPPTTQSRSDHPAVLDEDDLEPVDQFEESAADIEAGRTIPLEQVLEEIDPADRPRPPADAGDQVETRKPAKPQPEPAKLTPAAVSVPMAPSRETGYKGRHIDTQLTIHQADVLYRIRDGLDQTHARLASGRPVISPADALRYVIEQFDPPADSTNCT